jgi:CRP-like cAMP-binding protein/flavin-dependent dehydrogenase
VLGGGPSGSFFAYFLRQMALRAGREIEIDLYEPRDFSCVGPRGCNMCGGIVSESLMQSLATEGIHLPASVIQRRIDSYFLHMDVGSVRIATPLSELRIAAVARGSGPRNVAAPQPSFDAFLLDRAVSEGVRHVRERATSIRLDDGRPLVCTDKGGEATYDLLAGAVGVNSAILKDLSALDSYRAPQVTKAYVAELMLGEELIQRYLGSSMHVFLLDLPRLDFAALIPKSDFVTVCLLGEAIDKEVIDAFFAAPEVREVLPPHWELPRDLCHCSPKLNVSTAARPFGDRLVFIGDCGTTRLFKDGIGAAYRTAKAAARTAVFRGVAAEDFRRAFWPTCRRIHRDNRLGKLVFSLTRQIQRRRFARRALWRMTSREQVLQGQKRRMSRVLWDTFTGSAPYRSVVSRSLHPGFVGRLGWELASGLRDGDTLRPREQVTLATGETGLTARWCEAGEVLYREGDSGDCMHLVHDGEVELLRGEDGAERRIAVLRSGDFFGETALFGDGVRTATARVLAEGRVFTLERSTLQERIHGDPPMAFRLIEHLAHRIAELQGALIAAAAVSDLGWETPTTVKDDGEAAPALGAMGREYSDGDVIYRQGDRGDSMFVVLTGAVELTRRAADREFELAQLGPGAFFGEIALFEREVRSDTARVVEGGHVFTLERNGLLRRVHEDPSMALRLIGDMVLRLIDLEDALARFAGAVVSSPAAETPPVEGVSPPR